MEYNKISVHFIFTIIRSTEHDTKINKKNRFYAFDDSMYKVLYKPWKAYLESKGVTILLNANIEKIHYIPKFATISTLVVNHNNTEKIYSAGIFVNSMGGDSMAKLHPVEEVKEKLTKLYENGRQIQTQVLYYLPYKLQLDPYYTVLTIPDSPWFLMVKIDEAGSNSNYEMLLSCGIGIWNAPGLNGKNAINCNREELAQECWDQICKSQHNLKLSHSEVPKWDIWESFQFNNETNMLDTFEPKFSNNINTYALRTNYLDDKITNLYHGNALSKTRMNIYNMESAAEAGVECARLIIARGRNVDKITNEAAKNNKHDEKIKPLLKIIRYIDQLMFKINPFKSI